MLLLTPPTTITASTTSTTSTTARGIPVLSSCFLDVRVVRVWLRAGSLLRVQARSLYSPGRWQGGREWSLIAGTAARWHTILPSLAETKDALPKIIPLH